SRLKGRRHSSSPLAKGFPSPPTFAADDFVVEASSSGEEMGSCFYAPVDGQKDTSAARAAVLSRYLGSKGVTATSHEGDTLT
ncbi:MAG TPA: hypothetical protein V6D03_08775, partial [Candidatus Caenarcaniphilales bacterium]